MFISDINKKVITNKKTVVFYIMAAVFALLVNNIYGIFGHGVSSDAMTWMFLFPLLGGALFYLVLGILIPIYKIKGYRGFYNLYNSGIATLTVGSFLKGILEIAGTSSPYTVFFYIVGGGFIAIGLINLTYDLLMAISTRED